MLEARYLSPCINIIFPGAGIKLSKRVAYSLANKNEFANEDSLEDANAKHDHQPSRYAQPVVFHNTDADGFPEHQPDVVPVANTDSKCDPVPRRHAHKHALTNPDEKPHTDPDGVCYC